MANMLIIDSRIQKYTAHVETQLVSLGPEAVLLGKVKAMEALANQLQQELAYVNKVRADFEAARQTAVTPEDER